MESSGLKKIAVLFGGRSPEHWVSVKSGLFVLLNADKTLYQMQAIYVDQAGKIQNSDKCKLIIEAFLEKNHVALTKAEGNLGQEAKDFLIESAGDFDGAFLKAARAGEWDLLFPVFHGRYGEDGTIQGLAQYLSIACTGCNLLGSALGIDKILSKQFCSARGLAIAKYQIVLREEWSLKASSILDQIEHKLAYPCFVKPARLGSSIGVRRVKDRNQAKEAIEYALSFDTRILLEQEVNATEYAVGVLGHHGSIRTSAVAESSLSVESFDYEAKYGSTALDDIVPANLPSSMSDSLRNFAIDCYQALEMRGFCRVDMFLTKDGPVLNEVNTMPGLSAWAPFVIAWEYEGLNSMALVSAMIEQGLHSSSDDD